MSSKLYKHTQYKSQIPFIISQLIREYDISKANINILFKYGFLSEQQYQYFLQCPNMERKVTIGKMERANPKLIKIKEQGIEESRKLFFEYNDICDNDVLSIRNDAIFLINKTASITKFDNIEFKNKNTFTSFYKLDRKNVEAYYMYDSFTQQENLTIKGIKPEKLKYHENFFIDFLLAVFQSAELEGVDKTIELISSFNQLYVTLELENEYYRNFDETSMYLLSLSNKSYNLPYIERKNLNDINTMCNLNIIRELWGYFSALKFKFK